MQLKNQDPILYKKFLKTIEDTLAEVKQKRLSDLDYLSKVKELKDKVVNKKIIQFPKK